MGLAAFRLHLVRGTSVALAAGLLAACQGDGIATGGGNSSPSSASMHAPTINLQLSSATIEAGQSVTLNWNASDAQSCLASGGWSGSEPTSGTLSTTPLTATTSYTLKCTGTGGSASQSAEVQVTHAAPTITLSASPTTIGAGEGSTLTWATKHAQSCTAGGAWNGPVATSGTWPTGALTNTSDFGLTCTGPGGSSTQSVIVTVTNAAPEIQLTANPSTVVSGGSSTLTWSSLNATRCSASGAWSGSLNPNGSQPSGPLKTGSTFTLACTGLGGTATQSVTISIAAGAPTIQLSANPSTVAAGGSTTLSWSGTNTDQCTASGGWSGSKPVAGTQSSGAVQATTTYSLSCTGPAGTATQSTTVSVKSPTPTVQLSVGPSAVASGASATLTWSSANATACLASGAWTGAKVFSGSQSTGALTATSTYTLTCTGPGGSAQQSATVSVSAAAPSVRLTANPSSITSGGSAGLTWSSVNASACTASGAWSGTKSVSGSQSTGALTASATYMLTCSGPGGSAAQATTVTVTPVPTATVSLGASPSTVASGQTSTLTWSASNATSCMASGAWAGSRSLSGSATTGALSATSTYTLTCTGAGGSATQSITVSVTPPAPTVALAASPSTVTSGNSASLTWSSSNATSCTASGAWAGAKAVSGSQTTGALTANATYTLSCTGPGGSAAQTATVSVTSPAPAPTIALTASPSTVISGGSASLTWSASHASACTASGGWSGAEPLSGTQSTGALKASSTFTLSCTGPGGTANQSATVSVTQPAPSVSLAAGPSTVTSGNAATLTWSSTNATACTASGAWSGTQATAGSASTGALTSNSTYTLTCSGSGGSASQSVTVTVTTPAPTVTLTASPSTVKSGAASTLTWSSTNAAQCAASGGWSGSEATSGSQSTPSLTAATQFTLTCTGSGGSAAQSVTISVSAPTPTVSISANPTSISSGSSSTLSWSSTNATSCTASGGWSGTLATSGSQSTGALSASTTYGLSCTGPGGSASQSATVSVTPATTGSATLTWAAPTVNTNGTSVTPLVGYTIYYGTTEGALTQSTVVSGASTLTDTITGLTPGTWYFAVAADAADGTQSAMSEIGSKTI
jgi:hypothetical protein